MTEIVAYFLREVMDEGELITHTSVLDNEHVQELERVLQTGSPSAVRRFYANFPDRLDFDALDGLSDLIVERETDRVTDDDKKLITFFSDDARKGSYQAFISLLGVLIQMMDVMKELDDCKNSWIRSWLFPLPKNIEMTTYLWMYINLYEVMLDTMTQSLYKHYTEENVRTSQISDIEEKLENGEHLTAKKVEEELFGLDVLQNGHDSILSADRARMLRNRIGHANVFYDSKADEFVFRSGKRMDSSEFIDEFETLFQFTTAWLFNLNGENADISSTMEDYSRHISEKAQKELLEIERGGDTKKFNKVIHNIKTTEHDRS